MSDELFELVDALLAAVSTGLPALAERKRPRLAAGLTPAQIAAALRVGSKLVTQWRGRQRRSGPGRRPGLHLPAGGPGLPLPRPRAAHRGQAGPGRIRRTAAAAGHRRTAAGCGAGSAP